MCNASLSNYGWASVIVSEYIDINNLTVYKIGKIGILVGNAHFTNSVGTSTEIFRLPDKYKPKYNYTFMMSHQVNAMVLQYCYIDVNGIAKTWSNNAFLDQDYWFLMSPVVYVCSS